MNTRLTLIDGEVLIDDELERADLVVQDGRIAHIRYGETDEDRVGDDAIIDCAGLIVAPGLIDLQCNGAGGVDLTASVVDMPDAVRRVAAVLPRFGVTSFLPTVVTSPRDVRDAARGSLRHARANPGATAVALGLHFEGPMISDAHLGAHAGDLVAPLTSDEIEDWIADATVSMVTLAPEFDGAPAVIKRLTAAGVIVSAGHTGATADEFRAARANGLAYVTHLFNAMARLDHRRPGPIAAALTDDDVVVGMICDGIHVDPTAIRMAWRSLGPQRTSLVSDAAAPLGAPFGRFHLGGIDVVFDETGVRTDDGVLAGSALPLDQAVRNLVAFTDCTLLEALATVTTTPADLLGLTDRGRIVERARADLVILDPDGNLVTTIIEGDIAWKS